MTSRKALWFGPLALVLAMTSACSADFTFGDQVEGSGTLAGQQYAVGDFDEIEISDGLDFRIEIDPGGQKGVQIEADDNLLDRFVVEVVNDESLSISLPNNFSYSSNSSEEWVLTVTGYEISELEIRDGSAVTGDFPAVDSLTLKVLDGSDINISVDTEKFVIEANDGSSVVATGQAEFVDVKADDGSDVEITGVVVLDAKVDANDGSSLEIDVSGSIEGKADDGSDIRIWGDPSSVDIASDDDADVQRME